MQAAAPKYGCVWDDPNAERVSATHDVDLRALLFEAGWCKPVGGQEDMLTDIAMMLTR
ncbi:hypothetical protein ACLMAJ_35485 [Nocardia sp. KC 131]|uniref:hypothetical protein n=1 Tax=Nocardia arseniciresistens TaxID=3392119 RepID=UPI00398E9828